MANNEEITLHVSENSPYVIGARAYVEQTENGAVITIIDKEGTTTATVSNGKGIASATLNEDYTLTLIYTDGTSVTTTSIRGEKGESGVYCGSEEPDNPDVDVWIDPTGDPYPMEDEIADAVDEWITAHPEYVTTVEDGAITEPKLGNTLKSKVNNEYVSANIEFLYHLASDTPNGWGYGMCCVMWNSEHCIVSDFGADSDGSTLVNFLIAKGIHKVDAVIISHYHGDHARETSVKALLDSAIDTSNCVFYLPHKDIEWASFIGTSATDPMANESAVKALLSSYGIEFVEPTSEGYSVDVGEFNLKFYNVSSAYYSDYYSWLYLPRSGTISSSTRYNNFSMCTMVNVGSASFFLSGDIEKPAQENMSDAVKSADGILVPHHGIDLVESEAFVDSISAKVGVIAQYSYPNNENLDGELSPTAQKCKSIGTLLTTKTKNVALSVKGGELKALTGTTAKGLSLGDAVIEGGDLNDLDYGFAIISDGDLAETIANVPENFNRTSYYFTFPLNKNTTEYNRICQIGFCVENGTSPALAYRRKYGGEWNDWTYFSIPYNVQDTFAIGTTAYTIVRLLHQFVLNPRDVRGHIPLGEITNLNSCTTSGIYMCTNTATGIPSNINSASYVMVMSFKNSSGLVRCIQFLVPYDSASVAPWQVIMMRRYTEGASTPWTTWYRSAAFEALS